MHPILTDPPFSRAVQEILIGLVMQIIRAEKARGEIARVERSRLSEKAQQYQDLIDWMIYRMAGLTDEEVTGLEHRLAQML